MDKFKRRESEFNLKEMFIDIIEMMKFKANIKEIYCVVEFDDSVPSHVRGDDQRLMQVVINLISNSLKFTFVGGVTAKVAFDHQTSMLKVDIIDTGEGIQSENQENLFKLFARFGSNK